MINYLRKMMAINHTMTFFSVCSLHLSVSLHYTVLCNTLTSPILLKTRFWKQKTIILIARGLAIASITNLKLNPTLIEKQHALRTGSVPIVMKNLPHFNQQIGILATRAMWTEKCTCKLPIFCGCGNFQTNNRAATKTQSLYYTSCNLTQRM